MSSCSDVAIAYSPYVNVVHKPTGDAERHAKALSSEEADRHYAPDFKEIEAYVTTKDLGWIMHDRAERGYGYVTGTTDLGRKDAREYASIRGPGFQLSFKMLPQ